MSRFKNTVVAKWFDPSSGAYKNVEGSFANKGISYFEPPAFASAKGFDDWVLVLSAGK